MKIAESSLIIDYRRNAAGKLDFFFFIKTTQHNKQCLFSFQQSDGLFTSDKENPIQTWLVSRNRYSKRHALYTNPNKNYPRTYAHSSLMRSSFSILLLFPFRLICFVSGVLAATICYRVKYLRGQSRSIFFSFVFISPKYRRLQYVILLAWLGFFHCIFKFSFCAPVLFCYGSGH